MEVVLTRIDERTHRLTVTRADGSTDAVELETRSCLLHDLAHLAVESELGVREGFFGLVADGATLAEPLDAPGLMPVEVLAARVQTLWKSETPAEAWPDALTDTGLDADVVARIRERLRRLTGHWAATGYGSSMTVEWAEPDRA